MAHVAGLRVYPIKALDGTDRSAVGFAPGGALAGDRAFAVVGPDGEPINGKRTAQVHRLRSEYDREARRLTVAVAGSPASATTFDLDRDVEAFEDWFEGYYGVPVTLRRSVDQGFVDRPDAGPSVVSTATLEAVASWFDGLTVDGIRRRLRANVEVGGVPAFWEDRFVGEDAPVFVVQSATGGEIRFEGVEPCRRCVVPTRDPETGEETAGFRERFVERRAATFPDWADHDALPHDYTLMLIAQVPEDDRDGTLHVGDRVAVVEPGR